MSATLLNPSIVAKEAIRQLENNCVMANLVFRGYQEEWQRQHNGYKVGSSITVEAPKYFRVKDGATLDLVNLYMQSETFSLSFRKHVAFAVTSAEMTYGIDKFQEKFITPACQALGNYIDLTLLRMYRGICNQIGTPGITPKDFLTFALANAIMDDHAVPTTDRFCVIDPTTQAYMADHLKGIFNPALSGPALERAKLPNLAGMQMFMSQNVNTHTCGTAAGLTTPLKYGASSENDTHIDMDTNGSWTLTLTEGDIFTVAGTYGVNPISGQSTGKLRQFCAYTGELDGTPHVDNGTDATVATYPGVSPFQIRSESAAEDVLPYQTVNTIPADNAAISVAGTASLQHKVCLAFHRNALGLAMVPLEMPASVVWKAQETYNGYSIRVLRDYDVTNDQEVVRFDVLFGVKVLNPFMGCRIAGG